MSAESGRNHARTESKRVRREVVPDRDLFELIYRVHAVCGRFTSLTPPDELASLFDADLSEDLCGDTFHPNFNVAPSTKILVVAVSPARGRVVGRLQWGLVPEWTKVRQGTGHINARSETVAEKPSFRDSFRRRRCLVPMSGYYEWRTLDDAEGLVDGDATSKRVKRAVYVTRADGRPIAVAGLWSSWADRSLHTQDGPTTLKTCCVVTTEATGPLARVHDRMPLILEQKDWSMWLGEDSQDGSTDPRVANVVRVPPRTDHLKLIDVGPLVNSIRNNGPDLIVPVS
jgi:putative SOS response-associated peptidase YedK